ncbi:replication-relaxation family protein [Streptomyces sp. NPDC005122]
MSRTRPSVRADAVLRAPEAGLPVLLVEVDRCTEADDVLAAKFARYREFFRVKVKDHFIAASHGGQGVPLWQSMYPPTGREGYPPIAVVFDPGTRLGEQALKNRMTRVLDLTRDHWAGRHVRYSADGYVDYSDAIPVLFTTLARLQDSGPLAAVWWRCGHRRWETLTDALDNPNDADAWHCRDDARRVERERQEAQEKERRAGTGPRGLGPAARARAARTRPPALRDLRRPAQGDGDRRSVRSAAGRSQLRILPLRGRDHPTPDGTVRSPLRPPGQGHPTPACRAVKGASGRVLCGRDRPRARQHCHPNGPT